LIEPSGRSRSLASLRYLDTVAKIDGSWYFAERNSSPLGRDATDELGLDPSRHGLSASAPIAATKE